MNEQTSQESVYLFQNSYKNFLCHFILIDKNQRIKFLFMANKYKYSKFNSNKKNKSNSFWKNKTHDSWRCVVLIYEIILHIENCQNFVRLQNDYDKPMVATLVQRFWSYKTNNCRWSVFTLENSYILKTKCSNPPFYLLWFPKQLNINFK